MTASRLRIEIAELEERARQLHCYASTLELSNFATSRAHQFVQTYADVRAVSVNRVFFVRLLW